MKTIYYGTQLKMAYVLKKEIDSYWNMEESEVQFTTTIREMVMANHDLLYKNGDYTAIAKQKLGKRRLYLLTKVLGTPYNVELNRIEDELSNETYNKWRL